MAVQIYIVLAFYSFHHKIVEGDDWQWYQGIATHHNLQMCIYVSFLQNLGAFYANFKQCIFV